MSAAQVLVVHQSISCPHPLTGRAKSKNPTKKPLQTSWSLQTPAINRPLIGGCNRIQFISRSDGLTFIITRGSTCRELWAIHSLVEINCITSAQYLSSAQGTPMGAARTSFPPPRCQPSSGETLSPSLDGNSRVYQPFLEALCEGPELCRRRGGRPSHQSRTSPRHRRHTHCSSPRPALAQTHHSSFRGNCRTQWGLGGAIWALLLLLSSGESGAPLPPEHHQPPQHFSR